jgi:hypothetical protein
MRHAESGTSAAVKRRAVETINNVRILPVYVCTYILWHVDQLLGNDSDISNDTTAAAK